MTVGHVRAPYTVPPATQNVFSFFYSFSMGFLCTPPRTDLVGQVMLHLAACPCFAEPQQNEDCGGPEAGLKSVKHLRRLQSDSSLLALEIFSSKSTQVPGCVSTE